MEFTSDDPAVIRSARPAAATLVITLKDGSVDTIDLSPKWAAKLMKRIRQGGQSKLSLYGVLPEGSPELTPVNRGWAAYSEALQPHDWESWLQGKPGL